MADTTATNRIPMSMRRKCDECGRIFNLMDEDDSNEWWYGHDCESGE